MLSFSLICLGVASLLYSSFLLQVLIILLGSANIDPESNNWYLEYQLRSQQLASELRIDEGRYVEDRKFYDKVRGREFNGKGNFGLWQKRVKALLVQQGLPKTLQGKSAKPAGMSNEDWEEMDLKTASTIQLCLADEVMYLSLIHI